jgi:hypothetical protein
LGKQASIHVTVLARSADQAINSVAGASGFRDFPDLADDEGESQMQSSDPAVLSQLEIT